MASGPELSKRGVVERAASFFAGARRARGPVGAVRVVDPSPLNRPHITYNTVEELVRVDPLVKVRPAAMRRYRWADDRTLEVEVRGGERFPDGEPLTASSVKRGFEEVTRWAAPHPPGTRFNIDPRTRWEATGGAAQEVGRGEDLRVAWTSPAARQGLREG